ncbi:MAG: hypothetical protein ACK40G_01275 [Cytophagaceae bacterium]
MILTLQIRHLFVLAFLAITIQSVQAQKFAHAGEYMTYMSQQHREIMKDYMSYSSAVAHGKSARKVENKRQALLSTCKDAIKKISAMPPYNNDKSLRDSAVSFLKITYHVLNDDYAKIINMEEVAEQSYDAMEAYLLAQDLANDKLEEANKRLEITEKAFAASHNVTLIDGGNDELAKKVKITSQVNAYHRVVYLIFFKSYKQELYLWDAVSKKNVNAVEQNKNTLLKFAEEGLAKLDTMKGYNNDRSLVNACKQVLEFYKNEVSKINTVSNYFLKEENFQKIKKSFDSKKESERTQSDVDQFNKAVNEFNTAVNEYNTNNTSLDANRKKVIENWNKSSSGFMDKHVPKYR